MLQWLKDLITPYIGTLGDIYILLVLLTHCGDNGIACITLGVSTVFVGYMGLLMGGGPHVTCRL